MHLTKAHACGNDFIAVAAREVGDRDRPALARALCNRHCGVGGDGLIVYSLTPRGAAMTLFNADGSSAEVSGNGVRCLAAIVTRERPAPAEVVIDTDAGAKRLTRLAVDGARVTFRAAMGEPAEIRALDLEAAGERLRVVALRVGNPQCVLLAPLDPARFARLGPALARHPAFPEGTNVEIAEVAAADRIRILIWERGVGPTLASGTGACAAAVVAAIYGGAARDVEVVSPGGGQRVAWTDQGLLLTGWAEVVLEGQWLI